MTTALATRYRDHSVVGTPAQIANLLANHTAAGTLVAATAARPMPGPDTRVRVFVRLAAAPQTGSVERRPGRIVALALAAAGGLAGIAAIAAYLLGQLVAFVTAHAAQIVGVIVLAAILAALIGSRRTGRHCPGC